MAERKKYPYDEKARKRITKCLKKNYVQIRVSVRKEVRRKYKAYAAFKGMSLSEIIISHFEEMIERDGFVYEEPESIESSEEEGEDDSDNGDEV